jgi:hypothetical protein
LSFEDPVANLLRVAVEPRSHAFVSAQEAVASAASQPSGGFEHEAIIDANHGRHLYLCVIRDSCDTRKRLLVGQRPDVARRSVIYDPAARNALFRVVDRFGVALKWQWYGQKIFCLKSLVR